MHVTVQPRTYSQHFIDRERSQLLAMFNFLVVNVTRVKNDV